jgi:flagellar protein FliL
MANNEDLNLDVNPAGPASGRLWLVVLGVFTLGVALAGGASYVLLGGAERLADRGAEPSPPAVYLAIEPALVVNFQGEGRVRYVQVGVVVSSTEQRAMDAVERHMPVIRNNLIMLLSDKTYEELNSSEGKEQARRQVLETIQQVLLDRTGEGGVEAVYFTSFVMQ